MNDVKLKTKHIIMLSKLVAKMNIKLDLQEKDPTKLGMDIIMDIVMNIHLAEDEFYELIGSISGMDAKQAADTDIDDLIDVLKAVVNKIVNFIHQKQDESTT